MGYIMLMSMCIEDVDEPLKVFIICGQPSVACIVSHFNTIMAITARGARVMEAMAAYMKNYKRWDFLVIPKIEVSSVADGSLEGTFTVTEDITNINSSLHGGFTSSVMDIFSCYALLEHPLGAVGWTTQMNIIYLNPTKLGDKIYLRVSPYYVCRSRGLFNCTMKNEGGLMIAAGTVDLTLPRKPFLNMEILPYNPAEN